MLSDVKTGKQTFKVEATGRCKKHDCWLERSVTVKSDKQAIEVTFACISTISTHCDRFNWEITIGTAP